MLFNRTRLSLLLHRMEESGYIIEPGHRLGNAQQTYSVLIPGLDGICPLPDHFSGGSIQRLFWSQAELRWDSTANTVRCRWAYWSPGTLLLHAMISLLILLAWHAKAAAGPFLSILIASNAIPLAFYGWDAWRLQHAIRAFGTSVENPVGPG